MSRKGRRAPRDERRRREMTWHRADHAADGRPASTDPGGGTGHGGTLRLSHAPAADAAHRGERTVVHGLIAASVIVLAVLVITVVWPAVSFLFSGARTVVDTLSTHAAYIGAGVGSSEATAPSDGSETSLQAEISGIIGTRPIAEIVLGGDDPLADDALATCQAVTDRLPALIVQIVVDGEFAGGCEGDEVAYAADVEWAGWDVRFWLQQSYATDLVGGDIAQLTQQFALAYDAEVKGGRLMPAQREFHPPPQRTLIALGITAAVVVGTVLLFVLLRLVIRWAFSAADRRHAWEHRRDEIDGELGDIALIMVMVRPDLASDRTLSTAIGEVAADYRSALDGLAAAGPGDDLTGLAESVRRIRSRLAAAGAPA